MRQSHITQLRSVSFVPLLLVVAWCVISTDATAQMSAPRVEDAEHFVTISFWRTDDCSGEPVASNRFPVDYGSERCYSWPGRSGANSATNFICSADGFTYTQWTTLTCSGGRNPPGMVKTNYSDQCTQDVPPTLHAKITDFSGCEESK
jgi:hypothetical protein